MTDRDPTMERGDELAALPAMTDIVERLRDRGWTGNGALMAEAADTIERLRAALEPFQRNVESLSLGRALGHIEREHLWTARRALKGK